jgi:hypothetical protein
MFLRMTRLSLLSAIVLAGLQGPTGDTVRVCFTDAFTKSGSLWRAVVAHETLVSPQ